MAKGSRPTGRFGSLKKLLTPKRARVSPAPSVPPVRFRSVWGKEEVVEASANSFGFSEDRQETATVNQDDACSGRETHAATRKFAVTVEEELEESEEEDDWNLDEVEGVPPPNPYSVRRVSHSPLR